MGEREPLNSLSTALGLPGKDPSLTPARWQQLKELFTLALGQDPGQRAVFLQEACAEDESLRTEVESLLAASDDGKAATQKVFRSVSSSHPQPLPEEEKDSLLGHRVGDYRVERRLGYGGMAAVYLASRADEQFQMKVAIKLLRPDLDRDELLRRVDAEAFREHRGNRRDRHRAESR